MTAAKIAPWRLEETARGLADTQEVVSLYIMNDMMKPTAPGTEMMVPMAAAVPMERRIG